MKASKQGSLAALAVILFAVIMALLFFSCEKVEEPIMTGTVTFWTTEDSGSTYWDTGWILYVDDVKYGSIQKPYDIGTIDKIPLCGDTRFTNISLRPGNHYYYLTRSLPLQPLPNFFRSQTYHFDVTLGGCTIVRAEQ